MTKKVMEESIATIMAATKLENGQIQINWLDGEVRLLSIKRCKYKKDDLEFMLSRLYQKHGQDHCGSIVEYVKNNPK